ncbi:hypothetical protein CCHL11_00051 [Colletotrichum chlorophyti]|uniref:Uncharacterized protein n=1 Tax=Colletotrichum chlorophyti TaxID=708187 RepID=A0A1Q8RV48_9PEZI|nr:hypothetical protein CCHL11_00051 [Colletotrichum chlorophyti]
MLRHSFSSLVFLGLATLSTGHVLLPRDGDVAFGDKWKPHDMVTAFQQQAQDGVWGSIELLYKPGLNDGSGCFPYAAVDKDGNHGEGLRPRGKSGGDCRDPSKGQIYSRVGVSNGRPGVLYSWYLPKVQSGAESHKHFYLTVVVWLHTDKCGANANDFSIAGISYSTGKETFDTGSSSSTIYSSSDSGTGSVNTHAVVGYDGQANVFPSKDSAQYALSPPLISWSKLPKAATDQFNGMTYEHARCPFNDANIQSSMDAAYNADFYVNLAAEPADDCKAPSPTSSDTPAPTDPATTESSTSEPTATPTTSGNAANDPSEPIEDGPDIPISNPPADPTYTPSPGDV